MGVAGRNIVPARDGKGKSQGLQAETDIFCRSGAVCIVFLLLHGQVEQAAAVGDEIIPQWRPGQLQDRQGIDSAAPRGHAVEESGCNGLIIDKSRDRFLIAALYGPGEDPDGIIGRRLVYVLIVEYRRFQTEKQDTDGSQYGDIRFGYSMRIHGHSFFAYETKI